MADIITTNRRYDWQVGTNVGVPGGIYQYRSRTTSAIGGLDNTGVVNAAGLIQAAIDAAADDVCLTIPAGTFRLDSGINVGIKSDGSGKKRITLRGAGMGQTILKTYGSAAVQVSGGGGFPTNYPTAVYVAADVPAGTTTITTDVAHDNGNGLFTNLECAEDNTYPTVGAIPNPRPAMVLCTGTPTSTSFTFEPALPFAIKAGTKITRELGTNYPYYTIHTYRCGLEDLTVDAENSASTVSLGFYTNRECWLYNVEVKNITNYGINTAFTMYSSILHCSIHDQFDSYPSYTSRNLVLAAQCTAMHFADNIMFNGYSSMELNAGVTLSVFAHNISDRICIRSDLGSDFNINHGAHNSFNLYEGNILCRIQSDGYFGSSSNETINRNWIHGSNGYYSTDWGSGGVTVTGNRLPITLNRYAHFFNITGNQVGRTISGVTWEYSNVGRAFAGTSTTSVNLTGIIGTEPTFTTQTGLAYNNNGTVAILYSAADPTKWVLGSIRDYNSGTGTFYIEQVKRANGSGTVNDWVIVGGGGYGNNTAYALGGPNLGGGGLWFALGGIVAPQTRSIWWPAWDGKLKVWRGNYNSSTAYSIAGTGSSGTVDAVYFVANAQYQYNGGNGIVVWLAANPAKNGLTTWDEPGPASVDWAPAGQNANQELDYDVYGTAVIKGNWNIVDNAVPSNESLGGDTIATSYAYSAKPGYLGDRSWPAVDPTSPSQSFTLSGAGYRLVYYYTNGTWVGSDVPSYDPDDSGSPPVVVPDAPSSLTATTVSSSQINLAWTRNATTNTSVKLYQGTTSGVLTLIQTFAAGTISYSVTGLSASTAYYFEVVNTNVIGDSTASNEATATTSAAPTAPTAPTGVFALALSDTEIGLVWTDNSSNETGFKLYSGLVADFLAGPLPYVTTVAENTTTYRFTGLTPNTQYYFTVAATNGAGDSSRASESSATTYPAPGIAPVDVVTLRVGTLRL